MASSAAPSRSGRGPTRHTGTTARVSGRIDAKRAVTSPQRGADCRGLRVALGREALAEAEEWLLSPEGEDSTKSVYIARLDGLQALGDPIVRRYKEDEERPRVTIQLRETINKYMNQATSEDEKNPQFDENTIIKILLGAIDKQVDQSDELGKVG